MVYSRTKNIFIIFIYLISSINIIFAPFLRQINIIDEMLVLFLAIYSIRYISIYFNREVLTVFIILIGYLIYSSIIAINTSKGIILDFILFLKPFISFFVAFLIPISLKAPQKKILRIIFLCLGLYCWTILPYINQIYTNTARYYPACISCSIGYLFFSKGEKKDWLIALLLMIPGLAAIRAKFYTEFVFFIYIGFFIKGKIHFNIKWVVIFSFLILFSIYLNQEKFYAYFVSGYEDGAARSYFYAKTLDVLSHYFPLGSGFGSFGTEGAARFYSPLYHSLGFDYIWGLREIDYATDHDFLHDTFYPALAQFGIIGILLFIWFWGRRLKDAILLKDHHYYKLFIFIFFVIAIQNIAANAFTSADGVQYMLLMGMILSKNKLEYGKNKYNSSSI